MAKEKVLNKAGVEVLKEEVENMIPTSLPASDVYSWAKAKTKPTYTAEEVGADSTGAASSALTSAKSYTDTKASSTLTSAKSYTDTQVAAAQTAANTYTDEAVADMASATNLTSHINNTSNPHSVTKSQLGLGNVENKSSATIRGELTKANVTTALGYTPPTQDTNTHYTSKNVVGSTTATANTTTELANGNVYLNSVENNAVTSSHKISGSGATKVTTDTSGNIVISSTDTNTTYSAATTSTLGLVRVGSNITNSSGSISLTKENVTSALGYTPPTTNTTYSTFVKSGTGAAAGLVPAPSTTAGTTKYLREDGTWTVPPNTNTTYSVVTASANGLVPMFDAADGTIDSSSTDWVLTNNNGSIGWYKLPANAFNNTTYSSLKNPNALTVKGNGTTSFTYDGSSAKSLNIKAGTGVAVSSDTSGNITIATNGQGDAATLGGLSAEEVASNDNLLDNSRFSYNQRGATSYSASGYTVDRWKIAPNTSSGSIGALAVIEDTGVKLTTTSSNSLCLSQIVETEIESGTEVTLSIKVESISGTWELLQAENTSDVKSITSTGWQSITLNWADCSSTTNAGHGSFVIRSTGAGNITISATKLEYGSLRTKYIAPKGLDNTTQCQRYYSKIDLGTPISSCWGTGSKTLRLSFYTPAIMNSKPVSTIQTVVSSGYSWVIRVYDSTGTQVYETTTVPTITTNKKNGASINITLTFGDGTPNFSGHKNYMIGLGDGCALYFVLSADYA